MTRERGGWDPTVVGKPVSNRIRSGESSEDGTLNRRDPGLGREDTEDCTGDRSRKWEVLSQRDTRESHDPGSGVRLRKMVVRTVEEQ